MRKLLLNFRATPTSEQSLLPGLGVVCAKELAATQHRGGFHGGMLAFEVVGGYEHALHVMK